MFFKSWPNITIPKHTQIAKMLWNMKATLVSIVIAMLETVPYELVGGLNNLTVREQVETIQSTTLVTLARIQKRILRIWVDLLSLKLQEKIIGKRLCEKVWRSNNNNNNNNQVTLLVRIPLLSLALSLSLSLYLSIRFYHPLLLAGLPSNILCLHRAAEGRFFLVGQN